MKTIYNTYVKMESQEQCDRMKKVCIENGLPIWGGFDYTKKCLFGANINASEGDFYVVNSLTNICSRKNKYTEVTESEWLTLLKNKDMKTFEITEEQIKQLNKSAENDTPKLISVDLKNWFPNAFELELNKWYKSDMGGLWFAAEFLDGGKKQRSYGFNRKSEWINSGYRDSTGLVLATPQEIESALINEAKKRGYKDGNYKCLSLSSRTYSHSDDYIFYNDKLYSGWVDDHRNIIFQNGKWAEIIEQQKEYSMQEIADALNIDVNQLKIKK